MNAGSTHLSFVGVWQKAADLLHSLFNLGLCRVLLQDSIDVTHGHFAHLAVAASLEAGPVQGNWKPVSVLKPRVLFFSPHSNFKVSFLSSSDPFSKHS